MDTTEEKSEEDAENAFFSAFWEAKSISPIMVLREDRIRQMAEKLYDANDTPEETAWKFDSFATRTFFLRNRAPEWRKTIDADRADVLVCDRSAGTWSSFSSDLFLYERIVSSSLDWESISQFSVSDIMCVVDFISSAREEDDDPEEWGGVFNLETDILYDPLYLLEHSLGFLVFMMKHAVEERAKTRVIPPAWTRGVFDGAAYHRGAH